MGTNYYTLVPKCDHCLRDEDERGFHIGKSSAGWVFALRVYPDKDLNDWEDWKILLQQMQNHWGACAIDEYGTRIDYDMMIDRVENRSWKGRHDHLKDFLYHNHAVEGPNGLVRHDIERYSHREVKHGPGTWDLCNYEFS